MIKFQISKKRRSYITITVLILMMVLAAITYLFADAIYAELAIARNNKASQAAFALAEAGVQEAIYKVQYDTATRNAFLNTIDNDIPPFSHNPALFSNGSYSVTFQNTNEGVATVTSIGYYSMGLKTAQRKIKVNIAQSDSPPPYNDDEAIYVSAAENPEDLKIDDATVNIYDGGIISAKKINIEDSVVQVEKSITTSTMPDSYDVEDSTVKCECFIDVDPDPLNPPELCSVSGSCSVTHSSSTPSSIPSVSFDWYKEQSKISPNHYFVNKAAFNAFVPENTPFTINGIIYVDDNLKIDYRNITLNGILVSSKGIILDHTSSLIINKVDSQPSGILAMKKFETEDLAVLSGTGLIWAGNEVELDIHHAPTIEWTGGIFSRKIDIHEGTLNLHFNLNAINDPLIYNGDTPVIELNHWEEEY